jgi:hypothetical protein
MTTPELLMRQAMATEGFQLIMRSLDKYADDLQKEYDGINFVKDPDRAMRIQLTREIIKVDIRKIMEKIMNIDKPDPRWSFKVWLRSIVTVAVLCLAVSSYSATPPLETDGNRNGVQGAAPNGLLSQILTVGSTTFDLSDNIWWGIYSPVACKYRLMPTSAKAAYPQFTILAGERLGVVRHKFTKFVNYSGCTGAELSRQ